MLWDRLAFECCQSCIVGPQHVMLCMWVHLAIALGYTWGKVLFIIQSILFIILNYEIQRIGLLKLDSTLVLHLLRLEVLPPLFPLPFFMHMHHFQFFMVDLSGIMAYMLGFVWIWVFVVIWSYQVVIWYNFYHFEWSDLADDFGDEFWFIKMRNLCCLYFTHDGIELGSMIW